MVESFCFISFLNCCLAAGRDDAIARPTRSDQGRWWIDIDSCWCKKSVFLVGLTCSIEGCPSTALSVKVRCTLIWKLQVPEPGVARPGTDGADTCRTQIQFLASFLVLHHSHVSGPGAGDV